MKYPQNILTIALITSLLGCNGATVPDKPPVTEPPPNTGLKIKETREETLWVHHHRGWYTQVFPNVVTVLCYITTDNPSPIFTGKESCTIDAIAGFEYQQGYFYRLKLKKVIFDTTGVADARSFAYELKSVEEKIPATPGEAFVTRINYSRSLLFDNDLIYVNYANPIACLPGVCAEVSQALLQPNAYGVEVNAEFTSDLTEPYVITSVKGVLKNQPAQ